MQRTLFEAALLNVESVELPDYADFRQLYRNAHRRKQLDVDLKQPFAGTDEGVDETLAALLGLRRRYPTPPGGAPCGSSR
ncbi:MAG: hypothetical protein OXM88_11910 [bacterium]|nr:hypothetical protein [bacterium]